PLTIQISCISRPLVFVAENGCII
ncbi:hypothetical protein N499_1205B, partial [Wolbachia pipientis wVitA]